MISILFVCLANICRSPALEATLRHLAAKRNLSDKVHVESCGIGWVHLGQRADPRSFAAAKKKSIWIDHTTQQFQDHFFDIYDWIFVVDEEILEQLKLRSSKHQNKIKLATEFSFKYKSLPITDPYYMGEAGFDQMMEMTLDSCKGILDHLFGTC